jgi:endonuclease/exonuclease/phosphatase (EEP) superfamily protein YafD
MFGNALDHIFISKDKLEVIDGSQDVIVDINSSDHKPLFVEVRIP